MRFLPTVFLILVCCGTMRPASAQTISHVSTPCVGCTTQAQLNTAAMQFFKAYLEKTPPGYTGTVAGPGSYPYVCGQGQDGATTLLVNSTASSIIGSYYGCYVLPGRGAA